MKTQLTNYVRAGYSGLYIISHEEKRVEQEIKAVASDVGFKLFAWSITEGITDVEEGTTIKETEPPILMLDAFAKLEEKSILLLRDFHMLLAEPNPVVFRKLRDALNIGKDSNRVLIILGCQLRLPPELEKEITVIDFQLPDRAELKRVYDEIVKSAGIKPKANVKHVLDAASGLTTTEAENAFALSIIEAKDIMPAIVHREKASTIKKNGILEIVESKTTLDDIGGLEMLKLDLAEKRNLFTEEARNFGLQTPRGQLMVGQPGSGKSLTATATHNVFGIPLLRLEAGKLFGSLVGQSEGNWRTAFATAKAIAPCILWIDEVDGLTAGMQSSGETDSGVTKRVIKAMIQDMQDKSDGIFYTFTANDIDGIPDALIDRLDVWSVDLPNQSEREAIWKIHIAKRNRDPKKFDIEAIAKATDGFSGRQIEQVWLKAMTLAFNDKAREPKTEDVLTAAKRVTPTSTTMAASIEKRRQRLKDCATPASAPEQTHKSGRKLAVK